MNVDCTWIVICGTGAVYDESATFPLYFLVIFVLASEGQIILFLWGFCAFGFLGSMVGLSC